MSEDKNFQAKLNFLMNQTFQTPASEANRQNDTIQFNSQELQNVENKLQKKLQNMRMNKKIQKLSHELKKYLGRHYPIPYKQQYQVNEHWEDKKCHTQSQTQLQYYQYPNQYYLIVAIIILITNMLLFWCISVHKLFKIGDQISYPVMVVGLIIVFSDALMQHKYLSYYGVFQNFQLRKYFKAFWRHLILCCYFITIPAHYSNQNKELIVLDFLIIGLLKLRFDQIRKCVKLQIASTTYKNAVSMIELFGTLLPIAHFFALMLFFIAQTNEQKNWLVAKQLDQLSPIEKYVYSLYFTVTTMLTVGYGDISPVTIPEILMIMCVQIIGIVTYGYILSEIGHILSEMRQESEILNKDISTMTKMANYYDIDKGLVEKAKNFLVCRKRQTSYLTPEEEEQTLSKLQDDLREEICRQNSLRIIKSSLFYVCNWTKHFHIKIAKKVYKKIFTPNEQITQLMGKERIYIFKKGKVEIHANRPSAYGYKKHFKKILKTVEPNESMEVSDNIYGYSFILSNSPIRLTALNKEYVVAYYVERKDFMEAVMQSPLDREYFYEMKSKIDSTIFPQSWEAPSIVNPKQHYHPSIQHLIKKWKSQSKKVKNYRSSQVDIRRFRNRTKRIFELRSGEVEDIVIDFIGRCATGVESSNIIQLPTRENTQTKMMTRYQKSGIIQSSKSFEPSDSLTWAKSFVDYYVAGFKKENLHHFFEEGKDYGIYFKKFNRDEVLRRFETTDLLSSQIHGFKRRKALREIFSMGVSKR